MTHHTIVRRVSQVWGGRRLAVVGGALGVLFGGALLLAGCQSAAAERGLGTERDVSTALSGSGPTTLLPGGVAVSCAPGQQTLVRQAVVNGQTVARVECVGVQMATTTGDVASVYGQAAPVAGAPAVYRAATYSDEVVYQRPVRQAVRKSGRSWQKSAVIIGSSAGIGAGVGGIMGGKKGALIGAAIGGGGAAIWDQVTRRKQ